MEANSQNYYIYDRLITEWLFKLCADHEEYIVDT